MVRQMRACFCGDVSGQRRATDVHPARGFVLEKPDTQEIRASKKLAGIPTPLDLT